jgi:hypothetical protein
MNKRSIVKAITGLACVTLLAGCAATVERSEVAGRGPATSVPAAASGLVTLNMVLDPQHPRDAGWQKFRQEWYDIVSEQAQAKGLRFATQEGEPKPTGEAGTLMIVKVHDYRHVGIGARVAFGIFTGNAFIDASVELQDLGTGTSFSEHQYNTSSSAGHGVFAAVTPKQIYAITDEVLAQIKR